MIRIVNNGNVSPVFKAECVYCGCIFEFNKEDTKGEFFDQREGYNVLYIDCPCCNRSIGVKEKVIRYER